MRLAPWLLSGPDWSGLDELVYGLLGLACLGLLGAVAIVLLCVAVIRSRRARALAGAVGALVSLGLGVLLLLDSGNAIEPTPVRSWDRTDHVVSRCPDMAAPRGHTLYRSEWPTWGVGLHPVAGSVTVQRAPAGRFGTYADVRGDTVVLRFRRGRSDPDLGPEDVVASLLLPGRHGVVATGQSVIAFAPDGSVATYDPDLRLVRRAPSPVPVAARFFPGNRIVPDGRGGALVLFWWRDEGGVRARIDDVPAEGVTDWEPIEWRWAGADRAYLVRSDRGVCAHQDTTRESVVVHTDEGLSVEWSSPAEQAVQRGFFFVPFACGLLALLWLVYWLARRSRWKNALARGQPFVGALRSPDGAPALVLEDGTELRLDLGSARHCESVSDGAPCVVLGSSGETSAHYRDDARDHVRVDALFAGTLEEVREALVKKQDGLDTVAVYLLWFAVVLPWGLLMVAVRLF